MRKRWIASFLLIGAVDLTSAAEEPTPVVNKVRLDLQLSGLGAAGCKIEIRPAHPGCRFEAVVREFPSIPASGVLKVETVTIEASALNADRNCAFAITVTEPNAKPKVFKRNIRLDEPNPGSPTPEIAHTFYLRTTTIAKRDTP